MRWFLGLLLCFAGSASADELPSLESILTELAGTEVQVEGHLITSRTGSSSLRTNQGLLSVVFALPRDLYKEVLDCGIHRQEPGDFCRIRASAEISNAGYSFDLLVFKAEILTD